YSGTGLLSAIQGAISTAGASASLTAGYDASGNLILSSVDQGSSQSLQVTGGTALATLGLAAMSTASVGADALVSVDGTVNTLSTVVPGGSVSLTSGLGGSIGAVLVPGTSQAQVNSSLVSAGSLNATNVSTGNGSLASVVSNINAAGAGVSASAVQVGTNNYVLELSSSTTGVNGDLSVDTNAFASSSLGTLVVATAGANAKIQVGGSGGFTLSSPTDTFTGLLPGLSATVAAVSSTPVTLTVSPDATAAATQVQTMVTAANTALADIQKYAGYDASTKQAGPLMGSPLLQGLTNQVLGIIGSAMGTSTLGNGQSVGITLSNGTINFDQSVFKTAYSSNPTQVANLFTQGGTFAPSLAGYAQQVALSYAGNSTKAGAYNVTVSQSATTATDLGAVLSTKSVSAAEQLTITMGGTSVSYSTTAGETLANVAAGLDAALAGAGINMSAQVVNSGQQLQLTSGGYGSAATFQVTSNNVAAGTTGLAGGTANTPVAFAGTDVVGTINGVAATGQGQFLTAPSADPTLDGLSLLVTATGITTSTSLGTFTYSPGMAQQLSSLASGMSDPSTGAVTTTVQGLQNESSGLDPQISFYAALASREQTALQLLFSNLEVQLGSLKNQGAALTSALSNLS
ncbi:MAG: flagellar filament capping protein FliD, partial [Acidimicrobiales bacterium]